MQGFHPENADLKRALATLQGAYPVADEERPERRVSFGRSSDNLLKVQVESLAARIAEIESDMERRDRVHAKESHATDEHLNSIELIILPEESIDRDVSDPESTGMQELSDANEIEVTIEGLIITSNGSSEKNDNNPVPSQTQVPQSSDQCCIFCHCFPTASAEEEA